MIISFNYFQLSPKSRQGYYDGLLTVEGGGIIQSSCLKVLATDMTVDDGGLVTVSHRGHITGPGAGASSTGGGYGGRGGVGSVGKENEC